MSIPTSIQASAAASAVAAEAAAYPTKVMPKCGAFRRQFSHSLFQGGLLTVIPERLYYSAKATSSSGYNTSESMSFIATEYENADCADIKAAVQEKTGLTTSVVNAVIMPFFEFRRSSEHLLVYHVPSCLSVDRVRIAFPLPEYIPSIHIAIPIEEALYSPRPCIRLSTSSNEQVQMVSCITQNQRHTNEVDWTISKLERETTTEETPYHIFLKEPSIELLILTGRGEVIFMHIQTIAITTPAYVWQSSEETRLNVFHDWLESNSQSVTNYASSCRDLDLDRHNILYRILEIKQQILHFKGEIGRIEREKSFQQKALSCCYGKSSGKDNIEARIEAFQKQIDDYKEKIEACRSTLKAIQETDTIKRKIPPYARSNTAILC